MEQFSNLFTAESAAGLQIKSDRRGKVLILGALVAARRLAQEFVAEGFEPFVPGWSDDRLPSVLDPDAGRQLRELLMGYCAEKRFAPEGMPRYLHPALTAWADRPELPILGQQCGLNVIAPSARTLTFFANKLHLLQEAENFGIPNLVIPPAEPIHSLREIEVFIQRQRLSFPFVLKSAKGDARLGVTVVQDAQELESRLPLWIEQLRRNCGEVILFGERYLEGARLVTVPFARFLDGRTETFPLIDGSLQCRYRKIVEFCPAEGLGAGAEKQLREWTLALAQHAGYVGVGTLDFLSDSNRAYLISGSARLDMSFPLWEQIAGTRAVAWQMAAMEGGGSGAAFPPQNVAKRESALLLRLYAEDPILQLPQPGRVQELSEVRQWSFPSAQADLELGIETEQAVRIAGQGVIGTLWTSAQSRSQAVLTARGALDELWIAGSLQTNERFLSELLLHPWVKEGIFHMGFIDEEFLPALRPPGELSRLFVSIAMGCPVEGGREALPGERWVVGDHWVKAERDEIDWIDGPHYWHPSEVPAPLDRSHLTGVSGRIRMPDGRVFRVCAYPVSESKWQIRLGSWVMMTRWVPPKGTVKNKSQPRLSSMIPGRVHSVLFRNGATVPAHEPLLIVESLGMLIPHALPVEVRIHRWRVSAEDRVFAGQELAEFEVLAK